MKVKILESLDNKELENMVNEAISKHADYQITLQYKVTYCSPVVLYSVMIIYIDV